MASRYRNGICLGGVAGLSIISFIFAAIWYIDPALLTLVLKFKAAECRTIRGDFLIGINNCSWTSCRLGCTKEIYRCWKILVEVNSSRQEVDLEKPNETRLYPNVRGCGYPPELNCEKFFYDYGPINTTFPCWISTVDPSIAITQLNLKRAKREVLLSLIPLFIFIVFVLYAFCRLGVFSICNPSKQCCPPAQDTKIDIPKLTPAKLQDYKKSLNEKREEAILKMQYHSAKRRPGSQKERQVIVRELVPIQESSTQTSPPSPSTSDVRRRGPSPNAVLPLPSSISNPICRPDNVDDIIRSVSFDNQDSLENSFTSCGGDSDGFFDESGGDHFRKSYSLKSYSKLKLK
ncbi:unnamed protein product [Lepeophtheirus salmonis]|uniref:(salmon louse) hypothetical protein n=1 Tax=Lepeophtheirus salmonis TaxID=72036 RepID=A0A7R8HC62_LEPSM|nr:unnamed protein product [Lepeophtheirus salmonis]CAF2996142.1 unnamed protein product [Lepeophtheirus salmonis]